MSVQNLLTVRCQFLIVYSRWQFRHTLLLSGLRRWIVLVESHPLLLDERPRPWNELIHTKRNCLHVTIFTQRSETESMWLARKLPLWMPLPTLKHFLRENEEEEKHIYPDFCLVHSSEWLLNKIIKKRKGIGTQSISVLVSNKYVHSKLYKQDSKYKNAVECSVSLGNMSHGSLAKQCSR